ncbi:hypothetical protein Hanom_Chr16g01415731 [Helianthus anomalus]
MVYLVQVWVWLGLCSVFSQGSSFSSTQYISVRPDSTRCSVQLSQTRSTGQS